MCGSMLRTCHTQPAYRFAVPPYRLLIGLQTLHEKTWIIRSPLLSCATLCVRLEARDRSGTHEDS